MLLKFEKCKLSKEKTKNLKAGAFGIGTRATASEAQTRTELL